MLTQRSAINHCDFFPPISCKTRFFRQISVVTKLKEIANFQDFRKNVNIVMRIFAKILVDLEIFQVKVESEESQVHLALSGVSVLELFVPRSVTDKL